MKEKLRLSAANQAQQKQEKNIGEQSQITHNNAKCHLSAIKIK